MRNLPVNTLKALGPDLSRHILDFFPLLRHDSLYLSYQLMFSVLSSPTRNPSHPWSTQNSNSKNQCIGSSPFYYRLLGPEFQQLRTVIHVSKDTRFSDLQGYFGTKTSVLSVAYARENYSAPHPLVGFMSGISSADAYGVLHFIYLDSEAEPREFICTRLKSLKPYRMAHLLRFAHIDPVDVAPVLNLLSAGVLDINLLITGYSFPLLFSTTVNYPHMILADLFGKLLDEIPWHLEPSTFPSESLAVSLSTNERLDSLEREQYEVKEKIHRTVIFRVSDLRCLLSTNRGLLSAAMDLIPVDVILSSHTLTQLISESTDHLSSAVAKSLLAGLPPKPTKASDRTPRRKRKVSRTSGEPNKVQRLC